MYAWKNKYALTSPSSSWYDMVSTISQCYVDAGLKGENVIS